MQRLVNQCLRDRKVSVHAGGSRNVTKRVVKNPGKRNVMNKFPKLGERTGGEEGFQYGLGKVRFATSLKLGLQCLFHFSPLIPRVVDVVRIDQSFKLRLQL